jgi:hypothetical protein
MLEQSKGKDPDRGYKHAIDYFPGLKDYKRLASRMYRSRRSDALAEAEEFLLKKCYQVSPLL